MNHRALLSPFIKATKGWVAHQLTSIPETSELHAALKKSRVHLEHREWEAAFLSINKARAQVSSPVEIQVARDGEELTAALLRAL